MPEERSGGFNSHKFGAFNRNERSFKKTPSYEAKRMTTSIDIINKELLLNIIGFDRRKTLFKELTNAVDLYSEIHAVLGDEIENKTLYVESAFEKIEGFDLSKINKDTGLKSKKTSTKISKTSKQLLDDIVGFDRRKTIYSELNKAIDLYYSVYQLVGDETPNKTEYVLQVIDKFKNNQSA